MKHDKIVSIAYYKYIGKYVVNFSSPAGKYSITCDNLEREEKAFLINAKKNGKIFDCVNMALYA